MSVGVLMSRFFAEKNEDRRSHHGRKDVLGFA